MTLPIIVIGAGICGVSTAIWLQRSGHQVILMDKGQPGMGTSFGNAGLLAPWAVDPVSSPRLWSQIPYYLTNPNSPLFLQWNYFPKLLPWLIKFLSNATDSQTRRIVAGLAPILHDSVDQHKELVRGTSAEKWVVDSKFSYAYPSQTAFKADAYSWKMKASAGLTPNIISGHAVQEEEPILGSAIQCLAVLEGLGHITNPGQYVKELAQYFVDNGGRFIQADVKNLHRRQDRISEVQTDQGSFRCGSAVITAGIWSKELMIKLGLKIPLVAERGYHVIFENPSEVPRNPMVITNGKFGVNPMEMGLRCAGIVELGDHQAAASNTPLRVLRKHAKAVFPNLKFTATQEWMGFRPTTPDSTPLIGELGNSGIFTGFGHQHIGITAGPKTGRLIAELINGQTPDIDMSPYNPERYVI